MANIVLVGPVACTINGAIAVTVTDAEINGTRPVKVKFGALGSIGIAKGQETVTGNLTLAVPTSGLEIDVMGVLDAAVGFAFQFPLGTEEHVLLGCQRSDRNVKITQEQGDTVFTFKFTATDWLRVR